MYRVAVIGDKDSVLMFKALGVDVYTAVDGEDAKKLVNKLAQEDVGIIFITEDFAAKIQDTIDKYREKMTPAIILIPSNKEDLGLGMADINKSVEKAVGANILN
ncbi:MULTISPECIES: V-type ATP synthase subunit F [Anaerococcus]|uniref:V-type ATP synthase subunit F n=3 Tax=Anaerococcus TaxID=165779 RepID=C7HVS9_9FIRM|nr:MULTISPECIES: V-type ATP synthase subunit F [Anaerococcus]EEU12219.1 ATP synthase, subunit F [Anaerococcus vaginalis ATCC 51170]MBS4889821.1 V-type ATP synthase subunit F [Anaerococcus vaginalis]MBS6921769.1 V-type ATP synthase subunit F [Anaerococcus vaginalis]MDD7766706.1 V-type ATP synthase subunit F [Anaerococcus vaginalis]MDU0945366.1 V-type ATP synthase subunit F [Anaerococcus vaginalis]